MLARELRTGKLSQFSLSEFAELCDIPYPQALKVGYELFDAFLKKVYADNVVTDKEQRQLDLVIKALDIDPHEAIRAARPQRGPVSRGGFRGPLRWSRDAEEARDLARLRDSLGFSGEEARLASSDMTSRAYLDLLRRIVKDGTLNPQYLAYLEEVKKALNLHAAETRKELHNELISIYRRTVILVLNDGEVTDEEVRLLGWLKEESGFTDDDVESFDEQIERSFMLSNLRRGQLPNVRTRKLIPSGEICHYEGDCTYTHKTPAGKVHEYDGELLVTSKKVTFVSDEKSFEFSPSKIIDIRMEKRNEGIFIKTSNNRGGGSYDVEDAEELEAILCAIVRKHKYLLVEGFSSTRSRHIPPDVRSEVYARDGGKCVNCQADEYLEFDHIIPHSKGGANTLKNVQLLCRRCNLAKSDRI